MPETTTHDIKEYIFNLPTHELLHGLDKLMEGLTLHPEELLRLDQRTIPMNTGGKKNFQPTRSQTVLTIWKSWRRNTSPPQAKVGSTKGGMTSRKHDIFKSTKSQVFTFNLDKLEKGFIPSPHGAPNTRVTCENIPSWAGLFLHNV